MKVVGMWPHKVKDLSTRDSVWDLSSVVCVWFGLGDQRTIQRPRLQTFSILNQVQWVLKHKSIDVFHASIATSGCCAATVHLGKTNKKMSVCHLGGTRNELYVNIICSATELLIAALHQALSLATLSSLCILQNDLNPSFTSGWLSITHYIKQIYTES